MDFNDEFFDQIQCKNIRDPFLLIVHMKSDEIKLGNNVHMSRVLKKIRFALVMSPMFDMD